MSEHVEARPAGSGAVAPAHTVSPVGPDSPARTDSPVTRTTVRLIAWGRVVRRRAATAGRAVARTWSHSLQLRVALTTLVVSGVVVLIIGIFLVDQISAGVLRAKRTAAIAQVDTGRAAANQALASANFADIQSVAQGVRDVRDELAASGNDAGLFRIVIKSETSNRSLAGVFDPDPVPTTLRRVVQGNNVAVQYSRVNATASGPQVSGFVVGEPVRAQGGLFEIYYLFPLSAEEDTLALVQRTVLLAGLGLVLFVAMIAVIVTRQVVRPVRVAARTAARLAGGDLSQRIKVRGTDDIAQLGQAFNEMAGSLQRQIRRLEDMSRLQRRFTSDVSHELRTPLTTIRMAAEVLHARRGSFPPQIARSAESEIIDLRAVVRRAVDAHRTLATRHGCQVLTEMPAEPVAVEIDPRRVERILRNLLGNALDYGDGRPVVVTIGADEDAAAVTVRDNGVGLRPGEAGLVFNRFWRGDPSRSRLTGGTGLGLAISLEDARLHGGWLQAWGERGVGAQFRLTVPRRVGQTLSSSLDGQR